MTVAEAAAQCSTTPAAMAPLTNRQVVTLACTTLFALDMRTYTLLPRAHAHAHMHTTYSQKKRRLLKAKKKRKEKRKKLRRSNNNNPNAKANLACSGTANKATQIGEENQPVKQPRTDSNWKKVKTRLEDTIAAWGKKTLPPVGILMVLRCVLYFMATHVMALTPACCATAHVLRMGDKTVINHGKDYVDQPEPQPMPRHKKKKKAGRGSLVFKDKYKDKFMVLKNAHLKHIVRYVHLQNEMHVAMTSVR